MALFFFKERKPRRFQYKPHFYNPEKEEFDNRIKTIKHEIGIEDEDIDTRQTYKGHSVIKFRKTLAVKTKTPRVKLLIIVIAFILLVIIFYLIGVMTTHIIKNV